MSSLLSALQESFSFICVCVVTFVVLLLIGKIAEKKLIGENRKASGVHYIAYIAMFSALAGVLMLFEIPLFFAPNFYKFDFSELPVLMCSFYLGPVAGITTAFLKVVVKLLLKGTTTAFVGDYASFLTCCALVVPASCIYHANKTKKNAIIGLVTGVIVLTIFGSLFNAYYLIPAFSSLFHAPIDAIIAMGSAVNSHITSIGTLVLFAVVPFNLLKGSVDAILAMLLYKRLEKIIFKN